MNWAIVISYDNKKCPAYSLTNSLTHLVSDTMCDWMVTPAGSSEGLMQSVAPSSRAMSNLEEFTSIAKMRLERKKARATVQYQYNQIFFVTSPGKVTEHKQKRDLSAVTRP